jgi:hypothetical protein
MKNSDLCNKVEKIAPDLCEKRSSPISAFFSISDLITCLDYQKVKIPDVTRADE